MNIKKILILLLIVVQIKYVSGMVRETIVGNVVAADKKYINFYRENLCENLCKNGFSMLGDLFRDMAHYWIDDDLLPENRRPFLHRWHLVEHSVLVAQYCDNGVICPILGQRLNLCESLRERECYVLSVAALIHDIGKAGEPDCSKAPQSTRDIFILDGDDIRYISKENHKMIGFEYVMHDIQNATEYRQYKKFDGNFFNFNDLLNEFKLNEVEKRIVAVLIGTHKWFEDVYLRDVFIQHSNPEKIKSFEVFKQNIFEMADKAGLPKEFQNSTLVEMVCILTLADVLAVYFDVEYEVDSPILGDFINPPARRFFAGPGWLASRKNDSELAVRSGYCQRILFGDPKFGVQKEEDGVITSSRGAIAIIDELMSEFI